MTIRQFIQTKSMKTIVGLFFLALLFGASDARAQCDGPKRVAFQRGLTTAVLKGAIPASKAICYQLRARGGQKMIVHLAAPARGSFSLSSPTGMTSSRSHRTWPAGRACLTKRVTTLL